MTAMHFTAGVLLSLLAAAAVRRHSSVARNDISEQLPALQLREWRSSLLLRTLELQKETERQMGRQTDPFGHAQFSLFEPFLGCPGRQGLLRFGGGGDGERQTPPYMLLDEEHMCI